MKDLNEKTGGAVNAVTVASVPQRQSFDEKFSVDEVARQLNATAEEFLAARDHSRTLILEETRRAVDTLAFEHALDSNFPAGALERLKAFQTYEEMAANLEGYEQEISEVKVGISLLTANVLYAEMRAVVDPHDNVNLPVSTVRSWAIWLLFVFITIINQLFSVRQLSIFLRAEVLQLLVYPVGRAAEKWLPDIGFTFFGVRHSLNPGPLNKKEHMLISTMASV